MKATRRRNTMMNTTNMTTTRMRTKMRNTTTTTIAQPKRSTKRATPTTPANQLPVTPTTRYVTLTTVVKRMSVPSGTYNPTILKFDVMIHK